MNFDLKAKDFDAEEKFKRSKAIADEIRFHVKDSEKRQP